MSALAWDPFGGCSTDNSPIATMRELMGEFDDEQVVAEQQQLLTHMFAAQGRHDRLVPRRAVRLPARRPRRPARERRRLPPDGPGSARAEPRARRGGAHRPHGGAGHDALPGPGRDRGGESFEVLQTALNARENGNSIVHNYPQADHGYSEKSRQGTEANATAYALSWPQTVEFVKATTG